MVGFKSDTLLLLISLFNFFFFNNEVTRKLEIPYVAYVVFLLDCVV